MVWKAFEATMLLKDCFCFRVVPIHSGPLCPMLATVATHDLIDMKFVQFCLFLIHRKIQLFNVFDEECMHTENTDVCRLCQWGTCEVP